MPKIKDVSEAVIQAEKQNSIIRWEGASYQSAKRAAVADVRTGGKTHRLYVRPTEPKARTFHGLIDGTVVGVWGGFEMAKTGLAELFLASSRVKQSPSKRLTAPERASAKAATELGGLRALVKRIQEALATAETGSGLVEVARNAAAAERALAALETEAQGADGEDEAVRALARRVAGARGEES